MTFSPEKLLPILARLTETAGAPTRYCVAYSGGLDSRVLVQALAELRAQLGVSLILFHVDHGLSPLSRGWAEACRQTAAELGLDYRGFRVDARPRPGESPEAAARRERYRVLSGALQEGDWLLTAHHQDDQAETLLLQLLRGAGPRGLAAMPEVACCGRGRLCRPLLGFPRHALQAYAMSAGLSWIDDESNFDTGFDRNYLRHEIFPRLRERWPAAAATLARSAALNGEAAALLDEQADADLRAAVTDRTDALSVTALLELSETRLRNALTVWFRRLGLAPPSHRRMGVLINEGLRAKHDRTPVIAWPGVQVRRYRDRLFAMTPLASPPPGFEVIWDPTAPLVIPGHGRLVATPAVGKGVSAAGPFTVRFRQGGERCRPAGRKETHSLKKLFQDAGVPPWQRDRLPLLFLDGALAVVPGHWICEPFQAGEKLPGWLVQWQVERAEIE